ncbi:MAG: glycosyltransferase family 4 protein [Solirubrobacteraceae bacterium]
MTDDRETLRLVRIIARLNIGGPAIQAISLTRLLRVRGYETRLVRGRESADEGSMDYLARELGVFPTQIDSLRRDPGLGDLAALRRLVTILRHDRPRIVHTHAAKAGTLGRLAAVIAFPARSRRPILIHTFHGHSLTGYFSGPTAGFYRRVERILARQTDALVAVSREVRDDLVRLGVAPREQFVVVPLGLDLDRFLDDTDRAVRRAKLRAEWGIEEGDEVVTLVARLVPIKRVDRFLRVARLLSTRPRTRFVVVGDGELRERLAASADAQALKDRLLWAGFRRDVADVCFASDVVALTSDNEGTPVSLIEAQAAAVPVVGTDVGGVRSAVRHGETGLIAAVDDDRGLAGAISTLLDDPELARRLGSAGRVHAAESFARDRLVSDLDGMYRQLLGARPRQ